MAEINCPYFKAKGTHLWVSHVFQEHQGEVCHGCGISRG